MLAGYGVGLFANLEATANDWIHVRKTICPNAKLAGHYAKRLARYRHLLELLQQWAEQ